MACAYMRILYLYSILELLAYGLFITIFGLSAALLFGLGSFIVGLSLLRGRGFSVLTQEMRSRNIESLKAFNLSMFAGILLIIPGFITNVFGLLLLLPAIFQYFASRLSSRRYGHQRTAEHAHSDKDKDLHKGNVVDGEYQVVDKDEK
tara:strand:+ start:598 stop:1041 length:444 start_codon:yes stop_codon:yes gene_type:complete